MNARTLLNDLFSHMEWADALLWRALFETPEAMEDPDLRTRLLHIHLVQWGFLRAWQGKPFDFHEGDLLDPPGLERWAREYHGEVARYLEDVRETDLDRRSEMPWASAMRPTPSATSLGETFAQVAMHTAAHRAQVSLRLREKGGAPPLLDFIKWVWDGKPQAAWVDREGV
jgi:uncharacterized damage-inducible protein DinB